MDTGPALPADDPLPVVEDGAPAVQPSAAQLIDRRGRLRLVYEPIADLARGTICGYEAVERFPEAVAPEAWRVEAVRHGLEPDFDAFAVASVLHARESLPSGCVLTCNVRPSALAREPVRRVLARAGALDGLVIELAPRMPRRDEPRLVAAVAELRKAGATFAVDHVGGGDAVLRQCSLVRPEMVKLGALVVSGLHREPPKLTFLDWLSRLARRFGTALVAQGVSDVEEIDALVRLRIPLAQGPLIGVRAKTLTPVAFPLSSYVRERGLAMLEPGSLASVVEALPDGEPLPADALVVSASSGVAEVAQRAMLRPPATRFDPLVCCDAQGRHVGIVRVERLVEALARLLDRDAEGRAPAGA